MEADLGDIEPLHDMVKQYERDGELEMVRECLDGFLHQHPQRPVAQYLDAFLAMRSGDLAKAEALLRGLVAGPVFHARRYLSSHYLLADLLDQTGRDEEAMALLSKVKNAVLQNPDFETTLQHYDRGVAARMTMLDGFTTEMIEKWQSCAPFSPDDARVSFLGGHPRSGTTLLERILDSHPELTAFDEPSAFYRSIEPFLGRHGPDHPGISEITTEYRRQLLWSLGGNCESRVWLDKNPSLTACLHSWLRTFPGIKVVIALRHPLDVMLSCYFLDSTMNSLSSNFLSLERISKHYRDMMDVWLRLRELGGFSWMESRYEDTVENVEREGRRVTEFLGLSWHEHQSRFYEQKQKTALSAPTYHEVTKPVHRQSRERWRRYEKYLAPHIETLMPYMEKLGYG
jgi:tetratricopeptide (TPR) repeat protein